MAGRQWYDGRVTVVQWQGGSGMMAGWQWYDGRMAPWYDGSSRMAIEINRFILPSYHCHPAIQRELGIGYLSQFLC
jgi:hypothetical protein